MTIPVLIKLRFSFDNPVVTPMTEKDEELIIDLT